MLIASGINSQNLKENESHVEGLIQEVVDSVPTCSMWQQNRSIKASIYLEFQLYLRNNVTNQPAKLEDN